MNELDEKIEALAKEKCSKSYCPTCPMYKYKAANVGNCIDIVTARCVELHHEREANPGRWDGAPEWAIAAWVNWSDEEGRIRSSQTYHRTPPKDAKRLKAERIRDALADRRLDELIADIIERELRKE